MNVPEIRIAPRNDAPVNAEGDYVLYWMIAARRLGSNFALERAAGWARKLGKPLVVFEPLRCGYEWACDRFHRFVIEGMAVHEKRLRGSEVLYYPYVEPKPGDGKGLLAALAEKAAVVVTDDFPSFFLPRMVAAAAEQVPVLLEAVDGNGLLPMRAAEQVFLTAYHFRRFLQKTLPSHLGDAPAEDPLSGRLPARLAALPREIERRWPAATAELLAGGSLAALPIDHGIAAVAQTPGGEKGAQKRLAEFLDSKLASYGEGRNDAAQDVTSGLSPYLHFGNLSAHQLFAAVVARERWSPDRLAAKASGSREGWWGLSAAAEKFLDEAITWREVGYNMASHSDVYDRYESLPEWAQATLAKHAGDPRPEEYSLAELDAGTTHDPLWNAAQGQLRQEGKIHNYLRMLWGKKILEWSPSPRAALERTIELNNRYALDGRNPNSYSGIFWCLGRYDRPWAPERPIFGVIRYMSSDSTRRKMPITAYVDRYTSARQLRLV